MKAILLFFFLVASCKGHNMSPNKSHDYVVLAQEIQNKVADILPKRHSMKVIGDYAALFDQVNELGLSFQIQGPLSKDKLRYILIDCIQEYLCNVNFNNEIRPYLKNYPFLPKNLNITIFVVGKSKKDYYIFYPEIAVASTFGGKLYFKTDDPENEFVYKTEEEETYEEALAIVKSQYPEFVDRCEEK